MAAVEGVLALMIGSLMSVMVGAFKYMSKRNFLVLWSFYSFLKVHWYTENKELKLSWQWLLCDTSMLEYSSLLFRGQNSVALGVRCTPTPPAVLPTQNLH